MTLSKQAMADVLSALEHLPEDTWEVDDDACDCTYQRIGMWANPYIAETLEVRMCCIWKEIYALFPDKVRTIPGYRDAAGEWVTEPAEWDGESDMPAAIWYRQLARKQGRRVADVRAEYRMRDAERPRGTPRPAPQQPTGPTVTEVLFAAIDVLGEEVGRLRALVEGQGCQSSH